MDDVRAAPTAGIAACLLVVVALLVPYLLVAPGSAVSAYYDAGAITPLAAGLFSLVGVIVFAAGREERTDPPLAAGAGLVFGGFSLAVCLAWAATVPASVALQLGTADGPVAVFLEYHRFLVTLAAAGVAGAGAWYARVLRLL
ncbi:DUF7548 family protein [Halosegnis marinus]|uniref:Uncharacterized protein n=1 Tax=Halosegnis marinus TaxID=3034023 RepID=A0ABD5ZRK7_9EURY|nr:hypothetical protein [Halosegnis sp. DT85]